MERRNNRFEYKGDDLSRIVGLTDALFATTLTILVLEIKLPSLPKTAGDALLLNGLIEVSDKLFSYALTFVVAGIYWMAHRWDFDYIKKYDARILWYNLMFLLSIGLIPVSTAALGSHPDHQLIWNLYAVNVITIGLTLTAIWGYAVDNGLVDSSLDPKLLRYALLRHSLLPAVFLLSIPIAFISPRAAAVISFIVPLVYIIGERVSNQRVHIGETPTTTNQRIYMRIFWHFAGFLPLIILGIWLIWAFLIHKLGN